MKILQIESVYGLVIGVIGGMETFEIAHKQLMDKGPRRVSPFFVPMLIPDMATGQVSIDLCAKGPNGATVTACATGTNSIGEAFKIVQRGDADAMITGGTEAPITHMAIAGFSASRALSTNDDIETACRPSKKVETVLLWVKLYGILVIESLKSAQTRGANIYAEIVGYGTTGCNVIILQRQLQSESSIRAMQAAMDDAGIEPKDVQYLNAHGTSTPVGDLNEVKAIKNTFGEAAKHLKVSSTKSMTGHLLGATGRYEDNISSALSIKDSKVAPTIHAVTPDPECDLDIVPNEAQDLDITYAMSNSLDSVDITQYAYSRNLKHNYKIFSNVVLVTEDFCVFFSKMSDSTIVIIKYEILLIIRGLSM
ncbi:beta-ketoacyl synthase N-terminal-like domain-containing protein [Staphylococcus aureus]